MADFTSRTGARALSFERQETVRLARNLTAEDTGASSPLGPHALRASTIDLTVHGRTSADGASIELTAEHSDDGESWSTVGTIGTLEATGIASATVEPTKEWLRVSWSATESWSIDVTAAGHATEETRSAAALGDLTDVDTAGGSEGDVLAQQNDGSFALETPSGGGGSVLTATVPLTNADIIALGSEAPFEILAAPDQGSFYSIQFGLVAIDASAVPYGNIDASASMTIGASGARLSGGNNVQFGVLLGGDGVAAWMPFVPVQTVGENDGDQSLILSVYNNGQGPFIGGDAANSGYVKVWYTLETLP